MIRIVVDTLGGDLGADEAVLGAAKALKQRDDIYLTLVGNREQIENNMLAAHCDSSRYSIIETDEAILGTDAPTCVFRERQNSSMVLGLSQLTSNKADGIVSAGNTGALMVGSIFIVGMLGKMKQPALISMLPNLSAKLVCLADCGANLDSKPQDILEYALCGSAFSQSMNNTDSPTVGLLSVGSEPTKGNQLTKAAYTLLSEDPRINFIGNVEPSALTTGSVDCIVCDGFAGNILLKNSEAVGKAAITIALGRLSECNDSREKDSILGLIDALKAKFDFNSQGGATFVGVSKTVVKAHGSANADTFCACINQAATLIRNGFVDKLSILLV